MKIIKSIISNILRPKHSFIYTKKNGDTAFYIVTNCTAIKGKETTSFTNDSARAIGIQSLGFRALAVNRINKESGDKGIRSFYFDQIRELRKLSILERVVL